MAPSGDPSEALELAARFPGVVTLERRARTLREIVLELGDAPLLVLARDRADLYLRGRVFRASAGMAFLRVVRAEKGEIDPLVEIARLAPGDRVLDATLGLGGDALVAAQATRCEVVGLEKSALLCAFTQAGLRRLPGHGAAPGRAVTVLHGDHREAFAAMAPQSFDVVLLDPMFRETAESSPLFDVVRAQAEHAPLDAETLLAARRVARRGVLVKDAAPGRELGRLGIVPRLSRRSAAIAFGWLDAG